MEEVWPSFRATSALCKERERTSVSLLCKGNIIIANTQRAR
jgi:hypothetical protein